MPTFNITAPDGTKYTVEGPEGATEQQALEKVKAQHPEASPSVPADVAKESGKGLLRGTANLVGGIADDFMEPIREIVSAGRSLAGKPNEQPADPGYGSQITHAAGIEASPKTTAGRYAGATGEVLGNPATYLGPGSMPGKVLTGATSALGAEAAGDLAESAGAGKGGQVAARLAGAVAAGKAPAGAARLVTPLPSTAERQAAVQVLAHEGVDAQTAGQTTGSKATQYWENHLGDAPGAGGAATTARDEAGRQFTAAALRRAGIANEDLATPQVIDGAFHRIGGEMDAIAARNNAVQDTQFVQEMNAARDEYQATVQQGSRRAVVDNVIDDFTDRLTQNPVITGEQYQRFRSRLTRLQRGAADDPEYSQVLGDYVEAMDGMMARSITNPADMAAWQEARRQYRNLIPLARASVGAGEQAAEGVITPARLRTVLAGSQRGARDYARGRGDFADLTRAGNFILTPLPNSGTAQREMARAATTAIGGGLGMLAGGSVEAAAGMAAGAAAPGVAGRALMSPLAQGYLSNQAAPNLPAALQYPAAKAILTSPLAPDNGPLSQPTQ